MGDNTLEKWNVFNIKPFTTPKPLFTIGHKQKGQSINLSSILAILISEVDYK